MGPFKRTAAMMGGVARDLKLAGSYFDPRQVSFLIFYVTNRCNFKCGFCFYHEEIAKGRKSDELGLADIEKIARKAGPLIQLSLTGGEPFLRDDLTGITDAFIMNTGARYITIPTNASLTKKMTDYLTEALPRHPHTYFRIVFSIDGIGEAHDRYRSHSGAYSKIVESYAAVSPLRSIYRNLVLDANAVYTSETESSILDTLRTLGRDFSFDNLSVTYARGDVKEPELKDVHFQKYIEMNDYVASLARTKEDRSLYYVWRGVRDLSREYLIRTVAHNEFITPCVAGRKMLVVSETGEVFPCEILKKSMGNLKDYDFDIGKLVSSDENRKLMRWIRDSRCKCSFECALAANVLWGKAAYIKLARAALGNIGKDRRPEAVCKGC